MVFWAALLWGCNGGNTKIAARDTVEPGTIRVIPYHADLNITYKDKVGTMREWANNLGLPVMTGDYHGLHLRVWAWDSSNAKWVIDLMMRSGSGTCTVLSYTGRRVDSAFGYIYVHEQRKVVPQSGWTSFFNTLRRFHIPEMNEEKLSKDQLDFTELPYVWFEIDEPSQYHFVEYPDPFYFRKVDTACASIAEFFIYFNKEMVTKIMN